MDRPVGSPVEGRPPKFETRPRRGANSPCVPPLGNTFRYSAGSVGPNPRYTGSDRIATANLEPGIERRHHVLRRKTRLNGVLLSPVSTSAVALLVRAARERHSPWVNHV